MIAEASNLPEAYAEHPNVGFIIQHSSGLFLQFGRGPLGEGEAVECFERHLKQGDVIILWHRCEITGEWEVWKNT